MKRPTIALALGGGAARGLSHLGVLRVLDEERIPIDRIVGTSVGSMMGAMYAIDPNIERVIRRVSRGVNSPEFRRTRIHQLKRPSGRRADEGRWETVAAKIERALALGSSVTRRSFLTVAEVEEFTRQLLDDVDIGDMRIPYAATATNLHTGERVLLDSGPVIPAVSASSAMPGVFPPVTIDGRELIDGGLVSMVPVREARAAGADLVIAVNISASIDDAAPLDRAYEILFRTTEITKSELVRLQLRQADVVVEPEVGSLHWADFSSWQTCIRLGEEAMREALPRLKRRLRGGLLGRPLKRAERRRVMMSPAR